MVVNGVRKAAVAVVGSALTVGIALTGAGTASASSGGGCGGTATEQACVSAGNGQVTASASSNFGNGSCNEEVILWDYTSGGKALDTTFPCHNGPYTFTWVLTNPSSGHDYKAEVRFYWQGGSGYDYQLSPDLIY
ncbi:hypothetical protein [Streptacidiphilus sp. P02-A3a]|uniref:hypothetical protein n=1 Tax=Streptacidiphilus sp. P02-A3a TaxID=2704468 RepID=UPI0015FC5F62|nr:hypothetical protein [Streptacidiphilus sp. P02-A3a]QMU69600.1 hypothetical protein GXP74_16500 [Streptacidiphilus sp. P02-A3a]